MEHHNHLTYLSFWQARQYQTRLRPKTVHDTHSRLVCRVLHCSFDMMSARSARWRGKVQRLHFFVVSIVCQLRPLFFSFGNLFGALPGSARAVSIEQCFGRTHDEDELGVRAGPYRPLLLHETLRRASFGSSWNRLQSMVPLNLHKLRPGGRDTRWSPLRITPSSQPLILLRSSNSAVVQLQKPNDAVSSAWGPPMSLFASRSRSPGSLSMHPTPPRGQPPFPVVVTNAQTDHREHHSLRTVTRAKTCKSCASGRQSAMTSFRKRGKVVVCGCQCRRCRAGQLPSLEEYVYVVCQKCVQLCPRETWEAPFA